MVTGEVLANKLLSAAVMLSGMTISTGPAMKAWISTIQTSTNGSEQTIPHGHSTAPRLVWVVPAGKWLSTTSALVHTVADATNVYVTCTSGKKYRVICVF